MQLAVLGLNHRSAPVEVREKFSFSKDELETAISHVYEHEEVEECIILSTCNRTELYVVVDGIEEGDDISGYMLRLLTHLKGIHESEASPEWFFLYEGRRCIDHLFRVAASLDSLVLGEGQILSQLKMAYIESYSKGLTGSIFNIIFQKAISVGKKVRTTTGIANTPVSVSYTAVNLAEDTLDKPLSEAKVLILGAGQMSELTARHLQAKGVKSIFVSNRTYHKAVELAKEFKGKAVELDRFVEEAKTADIIITSTGAPHYVIERAEAEEIVANRIHPIVLIDIAVPRDIDPVVAEIPGIHLFNIDALESVVEANKAQREEEAKKAEPILEQAANELEDKLNYLSVRPMMVLISEKADRIRKREVHRAMAKLPDATERERRIINNMSRMLVRKLLRDPMIHLNEVAGKEKERDYWKLFQDMFALEMEEDA